MGPITLTWLAVITFSGLVFYGINVPTEKRTPAVYWVTGFLIAFHLLTQSFLFRIDVSPSAALAAKRTAEEALVKFDHFLQLTAVAPGKLHYAHPLAWYRIVTSSFLHYGWIHLIFNAWFFVVFGHVFETVFGAKKFLAVVAAGLIIPAALDGFFPMGISLIDVRYTGGFSGVVYAVMGAYLVCFPHSRAYGAVNYDLKFWAALFFLLLPVTMVTRFAGVALTETVMIMGVVAAFLLIQPEHARISAPVVLLMLYKLFQDVVLLQPIVRDMFSNTPWRVLGGFGVGVISGLIINGQRGWHLRWGDNTQGGTALRGAGAKTRMSVARLESEGRKSAEGAKVYLGQRVFVGDAERAVTFYRDVVITKYPETMLPLQEQMALARMLHFKGYDVEALHAYEVLLQQDRLPDEYNIARLKAAELIIKLAPEKSQKARDLLTRFEQGNITMVRDRVEAQRLRALLPVVEQEVPAEVPKEISYSFDDNLYAEAIADAPSKPINNVRRRRQAAAAGLREDAAYPAEQQPQFRKVRPRSFMYVPGASPVRLQHNKPDTDAGDEETLTDEELLKRHWKPLPCIAEQKPMSTSVLDRRLKNSRIIEEDTKPTLYSGAKDAAAKDYRAGNRLSQLELPKMGALIPATAEMPSTYGILDETGLAEIDLQKRVRLRSEPEGITLEMPGRGRRKSKAEPTSETRELWGPRVKPIEAQPVDVGNMADLQYGEAPATVADKKAETYAVLLEDSEQCKLASKFKAQQFELTSRYGAKDYSEICRMGFAPLFLYRGVQVQDKARLEETANEAGLKLRFIPEDHKILLIEPVEVIGFTLTAEGCKIKTAFGSRRLAWDEIALVSLCDIRLTPNSIAMHRLILEIVVLGKHGQRFQLFERTITVKGSTVAGESFEDSRQLLENAWYFSREQASQARPYPDELSEQRGLETFPLFESYAFYNEEILRQLFAKESEQN